MPQHYTFLKDETSYAIIKEARAQHRTTSALLRELAEEKYGAGKK